MRVKALSSLNFPTRMLACVSQHPWRTVALAVGAIALACIARFVHSRLSKKDDSNPPSPPFSSSQDSSTPVSKASDVALELQDLLLDNHAKFIQEIFSKFYSEKKTLKRFQEHLDSYCNYIKRIEYDPAKRDELENLEQTFFSTIKEPSLSLFQDSSTPLSTASDGSNHPLQFPSLSQPPPTSSTVIPSQASSTLPPTSSTGISSQDSPTSPISPKLEPCYLLLKKHAKLIRGIFNEVHFDDDHKGKTLNTFRSSLSSYCQHIMTGKYNIANMTELNTLQQIFSSILQELSPDQDFAISYFAVLFNDVSPACIRFLEAFSELEKSIDAQIKELPRPKEVNNKNFTVHYQNIFFEFNSLDDLISHSKYFSNFENKNSIKEIKLVRQSVTTPPPPSTAVDNDLHGGLLCALHYLQGEEFKSDLSKNPFAVLKVAFFLKIPRLMLLCERELIKTLIAGHFRWNQMQEFHFKGKDWMQGSTPNSYLEQIFSSICKELSPDQSIDKENFTRFLENGSLAQTQFREAFSALEEKIKAQIEALPRPEKVKDKGFTVYYNETPFVFNSLAELSSYANYFSSSENKDSIEIKLVQQPSVPPQAKITTTPPSPSSHESPTNTAVASFDSDVNGFALVCALNYLQGQDIGTHLSSCPWAILRAASFLKIPRLMLLCERELIEQIISGTSKIHGRLSSKGEEWAKNNIPNFYEALRITRIV